MDDQEDATNLTSVALFPARRYCLRRSSNDLKLYVKKQVRWPQITGYNPALMYGGNGWIKPCIALPVKRYEPAFVLAAGVNFRPTIGQQFGAVFVEAASSVDTFSGLWALQLDA